MPAKVDSILKTNVSGVDDIVHSTTFGETTVFSASLVNSIRFAVNKAKVDNYQTPFFSPRDIGANIYSYLPGYMSVTVTPGFQIYSGTNTKALFFNDTYQIADDLTMVRGNHQIGIGANLQYWKADYTSTSRANGNWIFDGRATGLGLADVLVGRVTSVEHGGLGKLPVNSWFPAAYAQDAWRVSSRVTVNGGVRWEPFFGQNVENGVISVFSMENFQRGIKSKVFLNAPAGLLYAGDEGFPENGKTGLDVQWWNLSPRFGVAWDVRGDGRLAVRSSYAMAYDFMSGEYHNINANAPPFGNRSLITDPPGRFDDPYSGRDPHPIVTGPTTGYPAFGTFGSMDPGINSPRIQSWNVTVEQQLGSQWGVSASYLGSHSDRLWAQVALNPGVFMGLGPCVINGVSYPVCSTNANLNQRRLLYQQNPREAGLIGALDLNTDVGYQNYRGLKLSAQRRSTGGVSLNGSYTLSQCKGTPTATGFNQQSAGYLKPEDPSFDAGYCDQDRTHIASLTTGYETPELANRGAERDRLALAALGYRLRAFRQPPEHHDRAGRCVYRAGGPAGEQGQRRLLRRGQNDHPVLQPGRVRTTRTRNVGRPRAQRRRRPELLEHRPGALAADCAGCDTTAGAAPRVVQPAEPFQLGQPGRELQRGHLRPHHDAGGGPAYHSVRRQVRFLKHEGREGCEGHEEVIRLFRRDLRDRRGLRGCSWRV